MNKLNIGNDMSVVKIPQIRLYAQSIKTDRDPDNQQISPSSIFKYFGISGLAGRHEEGDEIVRDFNAIPFLAYWDIYKNYYANKQEEYGVVIHTPAGGTNTALNAATLLNLVSGTLNVPIVVGTTYTIGILKWDSSLVLTFGTVPIGFNPKRLIFKIRIGTNIQTIRGSDIFGVWEDGNANQKIGSKVSMKWSSQPIEWSYVIYDNQGQESDQQPLLRKFPLSNIDLMRENILMDVQSVGAFVIDRGDNIEPYTLGLQNTGIVGNEKYSCQYGQEGLGIKTYQSDLFNNWMNTEWQENISNISAVSTAGNDFTIDSLNLAYKVYKMLMRVAVSGGSYDDWLDAIWTEDRKKSTESPIYEGGLSQELIFQEVISNSQTAEQPLGTLAGRGRMSGSRKGGNVTIKVGEPSYIIGIVSLTPRIDYSQGNRWDVNLKTLNDLHKPQLDAIGFQDLITDKMAYWDTYQIDNGAIVFRTAGKQPAWIDYMTNYNRCYGNFAIKSEEMFMTLNRRYEVEKDVNDIQISDVTTYIDPMKFNHIFANTRRDAQNFWTQIGVDMMVRRKMSSKVIPNL